MSLISNILSGALGSGITELKSIIAKNSKELFGILDTNFHHLTKEEIEKIEEDI